jgi:H+-translocating NAD(P) transhydrogenase subunit alpha
VAGYKAVLIAADGLPRMFPMLMTAAGTVTPARVLVIGAGVAGLQAIATARRLGAVVSGYDIRPAAREQVESLGARFVVLDLETSTSEDKGGYAKAMGEDFYRRQRELLGDVLAEQNVVITTAAVPGRKAPVLITADMVRRMSPGSIVVDIAAERGGNCELTRPGEEVEERGIRILGPLNLASTIPFHASQMYAKNISTFLNYLLKEGQPKWNRADEIVRETLVTHAGEVTQARVREALGLGAETPQVVDR